MRILVTGSSGFVGSALCASLAGHGFDIRGASRTQPINAKFPGKVIVIGDIGPKTDWIMALDGVDTIVHLAARVHVMQEMSSDPLAAYRAVNVEGTERLARVASMNGVRRLVYVSSIKVNGEGTGNRPFSDTDVPAPQDAYGVSKYEAELVLHKVANETGLEVVIVRPPLVYGPGVGGNFLRLLNLVLRGLPLPLASIHNRRSMIYLGNFVDALTTCVTQPDATGKTYLVCDGEEISTAQLMRSLAHLMGKSSFLFPAPTAVLRLGARFAGKSDEMERLLGSLVIDGARIRRELGWSPPSTMGQGLAETVGWFMERN